MLWTRSARGVYPVEAVCSIGNDIGEFLQLIDMHRKESWQFSMDEKACHKTENSKCLPKTWFLQPNKLRMWTGRWRVTGMQIASFHALEPESYDLHMSIDWQICQPICFQMNLRIRLGIMELSCLWYQAWMSFRSFNLGFLLVVVGMIGKALVILSLVAPAVTMTSTRIFCMLQSFCSGILHRLRWWEPLGVSWVSEFATHLSKGGVKLVHSAMAD